jgi:Nucleotidyltransferase of unknown function (DUF6036)
MYQDYKDLLSAFNAHNVKYLIVGGYAVIFHAQPRFTRDIDLFIKADLENARATYQALAAFGAPLQKTRVEDLADPKNFFRFGREPHAIDILPSIDGVEFDIAWGRRVEGVIDPQSGLAAYFISSADLVAAKIAAGRLQDLADVEALRKAEESKGE